MSRYPIWVVAVNADAARFFRQEAAGSPLEEHVELSDTADLFDHDNPNPESLRKHAGRVMVRTRADHTARAIRAFLLRVAAQIRMLLSREPAAGLVLCAPQDLLGQVRDNLGPRVSSQLSLEIPADLVRKPLAALEERLGAKIV